MYFFVKVNRENFKSFETLEEFSVCSICGFAYMKILLCFYPDIF